MKSTDSDEINKLKEIIESIKTGMLFTHTATDQWKGRPMTTVKVEDNGDLWFFTNEFSGNVYQICRNNEVFINYANPFLNTYAVIMGKAYLTREINKMNELYIPSIKNWFPAGLNDPDLLLIRIEPYGGEYWNAEGGKKLTAFKLFSDMHSDDEFINGKAGKTHLNYLSLSKLKR
jgi:general stress protein 26